MFHGVFLVRALSSRVSEGETEKWQAVVAGDFQTEVFSSAPRTTGAGRVVVGPPGELKRRGGGRLREAGSWRQLCCAELN